MSNSNPRPSPKKAKDDEAADTVDQSQLPAGDEDERDKECYYCGVTGARALREESPQSLIFENFDARQDIAAVSGRARV